jgi:hypothetical protein
VNKKQKILTIVALVAFVVLGAFHYLAVTDVYYLTRTSSLPILPIFGISVPSHAIVPDVRMPWFMLGVIYAALFFLLQNRRGGS